MITLKQLEKVKTLEDLQGLGIGELCVDISYRGGGVGFRNSDISRALDVSEYYLPRKFGAGCNYLGGGMRGSIFPSDYSDEITDRRKRQLLDAIAAACVRVYESIENEAGLNTEESPDSETNWEAIATRKARQSGITSAY